MVFKENWEKPGLQNQLPIGILEKMVQLGCPGKRLLSQEVFTSGCANFNIKLQFEKSEQPLVLRIYLRDPTAAYRERKLAGLLRQTVPAPLSYYIGDCEGYHFAITEFMPGITLRDLFLGNLNHHVGVIMHEVGALLSQLRAHEFPKAGFFDEDLNIIAPTPGEGYLSFVKACLEHKIVLSWLSSQTVAKIRYYLDQYGDLFPNENEKHLVHGDFDPANILVSKIDGAWKISGVLDWEFSFSGSVLCDVASMLRYAHQMPVIFEEAFLLGLNSGGISLGKNWRITVHLLNLLSLLDCLVRSDPLSCPNRCADIRELILNIIWKFGQIKMV